MYVMNTKSKQDHDNIKLTSTQRKSKAKQPKLQKPLAAQMIVEVNPNTNVPTIVDTEDFMTDVGYVLPEEGSWSSFSNFKKGIILYIGCALFVEFVLTVQVLGTDYEGWGKYFNNPYFTIQNIQEAVVVLGVLGVVALGVTLFGVWRDLFWPTITGVIAYMLLAFGLCLSNFLRAQAVTRYINGGPVIQKVIKNLPYEGHILMIISGFFSALTFLGLIAAMIFQDFDW